MARVDLTVQKISAAGVAQQTAIAGIADGHMFVNNDGQVFARVENTNGVSARTVTFVTSKSIDGLALADQTITIPANGVSMVGPFKPEIFNSLQGADSGKVYVDYQVGSKTSSKVAAVAGNNNSSKGTNSMNFDKWLKGMGFNSKKDDLNEQQLKSLQAMYAAEQKPQTAATGDKTDPDAVGVGGVGGVVTATDPVTQTVTAAATGTATVTATPDDNLQASRNKTADELMRQDKILKLCGNSHIELAAQAIKENWSFEKVELEHLRASRPAAGPYIITGGGRGGGRGGGGGGNSVPSSQVLEAAVCMSANLSKIDKSFNEQTLEAADKQYKGQIGLQQLLVEAAYANGYTGGFAFRSNMRDIVQAAFSTMSLPGIFSNIANKFLLAGFNAVEDTWKQLASVRNVSDFKTVTSYRLTGNFMYEEVAPDGELQHAKVGEESFTNQAKTYGKMFSVTRTDLINDDLGALTTTPKMIGRGGALKRNDVFWTRFLNNSTFFTSARKNYQAGTTTALSIDSLTIAEQMYFDQVDSDGHPLGISPALLLVPNALITLATQLMSSLQIREDGGSGKSRYATDNPHAGKFKPVRSSYLSNSKYTGNSTKAWYLLANPNDMPVIEMVVLNGSMVPKVESAAADFNTLGIQFRGYDDFGFELQEYKGGVKLKGEA